ncbi:MAG: helix-turn-helix domain-containing protein [Verrucomicrobiota bacterium]
MNETAIEKVETNGNGNGTLPPPVLFNITVTAKRLSMSVVSVRKLIRQERLHRLPNFRHILISESELQRFANAQ